MMTKLQTLIACSTAMLCFNPTQLFAATQCATADNNLNVHIPCLQVGADSFEANLAPSNTLAKKGMAWQVKDYKKIAPIKGCDTATTELNFESSCLQFKGKTYKVNFLANFSSAANLEVYWQLGPVAEAAASGTWTTYTHPCQENQTDAFWWDADDKTVWVGCGTGTTGKGLWRSTDGGKNWAEISGFMEGWRVNGIRRAADNRLYVAGTDTNSKNIVVSFDTSVSPFDSRLEFE